MSDVRHRRRIRNYLLNPKVQLKITLIMVTLTSLLTAVLGYIWYAEIRKASGVIKVSAISVLGNDAANQLAAELASEDVTRLMVLIGFGAALAVLIAAYGIVMTHRFAGPIFKIKRHMADIENDRLYALWGLRKGDQLQDFFEAFDAMHCALRSRTENDMLLLSATIAAIESESDLKTMLPVLQERLQQKGESLRGASKNTMRLFREPRTG